MMKTYGEKPIVFRLSEEEGAEEYMIGSEVGNYLRMFRGALYKKYPGLQRRTLSNDERRRLIEMGHSQHVTASSISLLLSKEVDELLAGNEEKFKGNAAAADTSFVATPRPKPRPQSVVPAMPNSSHLDAVPQPTPINRNRVIHKKVIEKWGRLTGHVRDFFFYLKYISSFCCVFLN